MNVDLEITCYPSRYCRLVIEKNLMMCNAVELAPFPIVFAEELSLALPTRIYLL